MVQSATRMILTLDYIGLGAQASLLNGGLKAWTGASYPVTTIAPTITPGRLRPQPTKGVTVYAEYVWNVGTKPAHVLIDGRASAFYDGTHRAARTRRPRQRRPSSTSRTTRKEMSPNRRMPVAAWSRRNSVASAWVASGMNSRPIGPKTSEPTT